MGPLVLRTLQTNKQLSLLVHIKFNTQTSSSVKYCSYCCLLLSLKYSLTYIQL